MVCPTTGYRVFRVTHPGVPGRPIPEATLMPSDDGDLWIVEFRTVRDLVAFLGRYASQEDVLFQPFGVRGSDGSIEPMTALPPIPR